MCPRCEPPRQGGSSSSRLSGSCTLLSSPGRVTVIERGLSPLATLRDNLRAAFPELDQLGIAACLDHLIAQGDLACPEPGLIQIGPKTQAAHERSHYLDLMVTFTGPDLLVGKYGVTEIGYLDPAVLLAKTGEPLRLLLGGRSWTAREVDWKRRIVWLEPAPQGGKARWMGTGRSMSAALAGEIRKLLLEGSAGAARLSKRALTALGELRDTMPTQTSPPAVQPLGNGRFLMWTYAGAEQNRKLQLAYRRAGASSSDGLSLTWAIDPRQLAALMDTDPDLSDKEISELADPFKFADLLPPAQLRQLVAGRLHLNANSAAPSHHSTEL